MSRAACTYVLRVHFVRHAESQNNALRVEEDGCEVVAYGRHPDPDLTPRGREQACATARHFFATQLAATKVLPAQNEEDDILPGPNPGLERVTKVYVSAMTRALRTAAPLVQMLSSDWAVDCVVWPELHETGGCFYGTRANKGANQPLTHGLTPPEILDIVSDAKMSQDHFIWGKNSAQRDSASGGGWWPGGFEDTADTAKRASRVARRLWDLACQHARSVVVDDAPANECRADAIIVIVHGNFFNLLLRSLFGLPVLSGQNEGDVPFFLTGNCAVTTLDFHVKLEKATDEPLTSLGVVGMNSQEHIPFEHRTGHTLEGFSYRPMSPQTMDASKDPK